LDQVTFDIFLALVFLFGLILSGAALVIKLKAQRSAK